MKVRIGHVKNALLHPTQNLADIALEVGFSNQSHMGRYFKKLIGISPREFKKISLTS